MIRSFRNQAAGDIWNGKNTPEARKLPQTIWSTAHRKLDMIHAAHDLGDLRVPPGNRLEKLKGGLKDRYSVRINDQYRVVFSWTPAGAEDVEITDYH